MINLESAQAVFADYVKNYNPNDGKIKLKIIHTYKTITHAEEIANFLLAAGTHALTSEDINLAKLIALLHDIGRFEQIRQTGSFTDDIKNGNDHAAYSINTLFSNDLIRKFITTPKFDEIIKTAIFNHNKYKLPTNLPPQALIHSQIIRDADKTDIFRLVLEEDFETLFHAGITSETLANDKVSDNIFANFMENRSILKPNRKTFLDQWVSYIAYIFDYNFNCSFKAVEKNNYINKLVGKINYNLPETKKRMELIRNHANNFIQTKLKTENIESFA